MNNELYTPFRCDLTDNATFDMHECLVGEAEWFKSRHSATDLMDTRLLSDLACLALRFGRTSDVAAELTRQCYGVLSGETAFWFTSQITSNIDLINETCCAVDRLLVLVNNAPNTHLAEEARGWAEDFSMEQPDDVRIELRFGPSPTAAAA